MNRVLVSLLMLCVTVFGVQSAMAQDGYRIRTGDVLSVEVVQDPSLNREVLVLPDGSINYPFVGTLRARGLTAAQVQAQIAAGISPNFAVTPDVFVAVSQLFVPQPPFPPVPGPTINIFIQGEVNAPGLIEVPPGTTLIQALATHGGFTNFAAIRRIQLRRHGPAHRARPRSSRHARLPRARTGGQRQPRPRAGGRGCDPRPAAAPVRVNRSPFRRVGGL
jgi:polysaccharide export outer membrane protein